jgi:hypothetical protein
MFSIHRIVRVEQDVSGLAWPSLPSEHVKLLRIIVSPSKLICTFTGAVRPVSVHLSQTLTTFPLGKVSIRPQPAFVKVRVWS